MAPGLLHAYIISASNSSAVYSEAMMKRRVLVAVLASVLGTGTSFAQSAQTPAPQTTPRPATAGAGSQTSDPSSKPATQTPRRRTTSGGAGEQAGHAAPKPQP